MIDRALVSARRQRPAVSQCAETQREPADIVGAPWTDSHQRLLKEAVVAWGVPDRAPPDLPALAYQEVAAPQRVLRAIRWTEAHPVEVRAVDPVPLNVHVAEVRRRARRTRLCRTIGVQHLAQLHVEVRPNA